MSAPVFWLVVGDLGKPFQQQLLDDDGNMVDLTGATFVFRFAIRDGVSPVLGGATGCSAIGAPTLGNFQYAWQAGDTLTPGLYYAEVAVTVGGKTTTYPRDPWVLEFRPEV